MKKTNPGMDNIHQKLNLLSAKAANLMKITKEQEAFGKRKQACFLEMLSIVEDLIKVFDDNDGSSVSKLVGRSNTLLTTYQDDLGKENKESK